MDSKNFSFIAFLIISVQTILAPFSPFFISKVYASNWIPNERCDYFKTFTLNEQCNIRGVMSSYSASAPPGECLFSGGNLTHRIVDANASPSTWYLCITTPNWVSLTGKEVTATYRYIGKNSEGNNWFSIVDIVEAYEPNQDPNIPRLISPNTNTEFSGNCDESRSPITGICRTRLNITTVSEVNDPDIREEYTMNYSQFIYSGSTNNFSSGAIGCSPNDCNGTTWRQISNIAQLHDGQTFWKTISFDKQGASRDSTNNGNAQFAVTTDTTPPNIPVLNTLPQFTKAVGIEESRQIELTFPLVNDNVSARDKIGYIVQYSTSPSFLAGETFTSSVSQFFNISSTNGRIEIGPKGFDHVVNTADDLQEDGMYYFRIKSHDTTNFYTNGQRNTSNWSAVVSTTIDATLPQITTDSYGVTGTRFSPNNVTSVGVKDSTTFSFSFQELHPKEARVEIYQNELDSLGNPQSTPVRVLTKDVTDSIYSNNALNIDFPWDGKDSSGNYLHDGAYIAFAVVEDKAGNLSYGNTDLNQTNNLFWEIVIIDNSEANVQVSFPLNNFWSNTESLVMKGQVTVPHDFGPDGIEGTLDDEQDYDIQNFTITNLLTTEILNVLFSNSGFFEQTLLLPNIQNQFELQTEDTVGNINKYNWIVYKDTQPPIISNIAPFGIQQKGEPRSIEFRVTDPGIETFDNSDIPIGVNPKGMEIWLEYNVLDISQPQPYPLMVEKFPLIGENYVNRSLVTDLHCVPYGLESTVEKNNTTAARIVSCKLDFISMLQPDATYRINIRVSDTAGNATQSKNVTFTIDNTIYSELIAPKSDSIYATGTVLFKGKASKGSELIIKNSQLDQTRQFRLDNQLDGAGIDSGDIKFIMSNFKVTCGEFMDVDLRSDTPDDELCNWEVNISQKYSLLDEDLTNNNQITVIDASENNKTININVTVNIYKLNLEIYTDKLYFSPNGDGHLDTVYFYQSITNNDDPLNVPAVSSYKLEIKSLDDMVIKTFEGTNNLPSITIFDGKFQTPDGIDQWIPNGEYKYNLEITTADGATISTVFKSIFAKSELTNEIFIMSPQTGFVTTQGLIFVEGQAPKADSTSIGELMGQIFVDICVDVTTVNNISCDSWITVVADSNGYFNSAAVVIPRLLEIPKSNVVITAIARDSFGNRTNTSNEVHITLDTIDPFISVSLTPSLTGITKEEDYIKFLNGEISIDQIRSIKLNTVVSENTSAVQFSYADFTNLPNRPDNLAYNYIATINNQIEESMQFNPYGNPSIKKNHTISISDASIPQSNCNNSNGCNWEYYLPISPDLGGIYEIEFVGKKGEIIQSMTAGFKVDGAIPAAPFVMLVEKCNERSADRSLELDQSCILDWSKIDNVNTNHYTDGGLVRFSGAAEPGTIVEIRSGAFVLASELVSENGIFQIYVDLDEILESGPENNTGLVCEQWGVVNDIQKCTNGSISLDVVGLELDDNGNVLREIYSEYSINFIIDLEFPKILEIKRQTPSKTIEGWVKSGDQVRYTIKSSEKLSYASLIKESGFVRILSLLSNENNGSQYWSEIINIDKESPDKNIPYEGYYYPQFNIMDLSGNKSNYNSINCNNNSEDVCDYRLYVDNTRPEDVFIDKSNWATSYAQGGIYANTNRSGDGSFTPEIGRTNPYYVIKSNAVTLTGKAEKNQRVEIWINNGLKDTIAVTNNNCTVSEGSFDKVTQDGITVKYAEKCDWKYDFVFPDNGSNDWEGVPNHFYIFQVRALDGAANVSNFSKQEIVFHDTAKPTIPDIYEAESSSYSDMIPNWSANSLSSPVPTTRDLQITLSSAAERLSDMEYTLNYPNENIQNFPLFMNNSSRLFKKTFSLGNQKDQRAGCMTMQGKFRVGICEDGKYNFSLAITDAAGNKSDTRNNVLILRDTVAPAIPQVNISKQGNTLSQKIDIKIDGEPNTIANIVVKNSRGTTFNLQRGLNNTGILDVADLIGNLICGNVTYTISVSLRDRAGNISEYSMPVEIKTSECPNCGTGDFISPIHNEKAKVAHPFGYSQGYFSGTQMHPGVDYGGVPAGTEVYPVASGTVIEVRYSLNCNGRENCKDRITGWEMGNYVRIDHGNGMQSRYLHLQHLTKETVSQFPKVGDVVNTNTLIGYIGNTGNSTGPHLHLDVYKNGKQVDPELYLQSGPTNLGEAEQQIYCSANAASYEDTQPIAKTTAVSKFVEFIDTNIVTDQTEIGNDSWVPEKNDYAAANKLISELDSVKAAVEKNVHIWSCKEGKGVWVIDFGSIKEKDGNTGYDGIAIMNPWDLKVYLVKNAIWEKYRDNHGPCGEIGIPKGTSGNVWEKDGHYTEERKELGFQVEDGRLSTNHFFVQRFQVADMKFSRLEEDKLKYQTINMSGFNPHSIYAREAKVPEYFEGKVSNYTVIPIIGDMSYLYEMEGGTFGRFGFPTGSAKKCNNDESGSIQAFTYETVNICYKKSENTNNSNTAYSFTVRGGSVPIRNMDERSINNTVNPVKRNVTLNFTEDLSEVKRKLTNPNSNIWIVSHGWNGNPNSSPKSIAENVSKLHQDDVVIITDWREGAEYKVVNVNGLYLPHCEAATWVKPTADGIYKVLTEQFGIQDGNRIRTIGHSFGSFVSATLSDKFESKGKLLIALDPALNACLSGNVVIQEYPSEVKIKDFNEVAQFSNAFIGSWTLAGDRTHASTADKTIKVAISYKDCGLIVAPIVGPKECIWQASKQHTHVHEVFQSILNTQHKNLDYNFLREEEDKNDPWKNGTLFMEENNSSNKNEVPFNTIKFERD